jgi:hypothetical protein
MPDTISEADVSTDATLHTEEDATNAFLAHLLPKEEQEDASKKPSDDQGDTEAATDENNEGDDASDESPDADGDDEGSGEEQKAKKFVEIDDNTFVKVKVGDEEIEVPVKDLTRVHGQEAAVTRKSQEAAEKRKAADAETAKAVATLDVMLKRAQERAAPYANIDFLALTKDPNITAEDLANLRNTAQTHFEDVRFLEQELGNFMGALQTRQKEEFKSAVKTCVEALTTKGTEDKPNPHYIEGWNTKLYDDTRSFAVEQGLSPEVVNNLVDPAAFKLIHMAMMFQRGATQVKTVKENKTPKRIVKTSNSPVIDKSSNSKKAIEAKAMAKLKASGSTEDAADAFFARLTANEDRE